MRYFNKFTKTEVIPGIHPINSECVVLSDDHFFWFQLPTGKAIEFDDDGLPVLIEDPGPSIEQKKFIERRWRDDEISKVVSWLDQLRNDEQFNVATYAQSYPAEQLNAYRVALCNYPESENFPNGIRPSVDDYGEPL